MVNGADFLFDESRHVGNFEAARVGLEDGGFQRTPLAGRRVGGDRLGLPLEVGRNLIRAIDAPKRFFSLIPRLGVPSPSA